MSCGLRKGRREGGREGFAATDVALAARVAWRTAWTMALISTLGFGSRGGLGFMWVNGTVVSGAVKSGLEETTGEVWSQYCSGE